MNDIKSESLKSFPVNDFKKEVVSLANLPTVDRVMLTSQLTVSYQQIYSVMPEKIQALMIEAAHLDALATCVRMQISEEFSKEVNRKIEQSKATNQ